MQSTSPICIKSCTELDHLSLNIFVALLHYKELVICNVMTSNNYIFRITIVLKFTVGIFYLLSSSLRTINKIPCIVPLCRCIHSRN